MPNFRSSRRAPQLKDNEIDHAIDLVDHDNSIPVDDARSLSVVTANTADLSASGQPLISPDSRAPLIQTSEGDPVHVSDDAGTDAGPSDGQDIAQPATNEAESSSARKETISAQRPLSKAFSSRSKRVSQHHPHTSKEHETAIDILFENERGAFLCGRPLFSSAALGNLDPPPWTNFAHKPSPTDIHNAQVPDPSWEWVWPEWRINRDEMIELDDDGWEYSFMFSKWFSWHGPKWYSSYVRRRAWTRRRVKKGFGYQAIDEHFMNTDYFTVTSPRQKHRSTVAIAAQVEQANVGQQSRASQELGLTIQKMLQEDDDKAYAKVVVKTADDLVPVLRLSRIDREKLEAVENYIENTADELLKLQDYMHEIMSIFVFQSSRKLLLTRLIQLHDEVVEKQRKGESRETQKMAENLSGAIRHADEEVRRLEYWSDIKGMAENGESGGAVDRVKGWDHGWEGLDNSGAKGVPGGEATLP
ncbi:Uu.00g106720.m01.CDS01 [Anthostomella pinea]|uniref:Uu.00g106720.m01.CDS01 n=1 Tax=Anthostomella pinea TaxID=933095 RepID=A0AAI8VF61_9PEZI|nr:Uu.00g106720.m01.CDS01 [Anthostomella pinea]